MANWKNIIFSKKRYGIGDKVAFSADGKMMIGVIKSRPATAWQPFVEVETSKGQKIWKDWNDLYVPPRKQLKKVI